MQNLDFITPPWYLESLELEPAPVYEAVGLQFVAKVSFDAESIEGKPIVETTTENVMYGYMEGKKLYITTEIPIIVDDDGRKRTVRPEWFPRHGLFF